MYISGNISTFAPRIHQGGDSINSLNSFQTEASGILSSVTRQQSGKWEKEARLSNFRITRNPAKLTQPFLTSWTPVRIRISGAGLSDVNGVYIQAAPNSTHYNLGLGPFIDDGNLWFEGHIQYSAQNWPDIISWETSFGVEPPPEGSFV